MTGTPWGNSLSALRSDIYQINMAASYSIRFALYAPFMILVALVLVYISSPDLVWIFIVVILVTAAMFGIISWMLQGQYKARQQTLTE